MADNNHLKKEWQSAGIVYICILVAVNVSTGLQAKRVTEDLLNTAKWYQLEVLIGEHVLLLICN